MEDSASCEVGARGRAERQISIRRRLTSAVEVFPLQENINKTIAEKLPVHLSFKKIPHIEDGKLVRPEQPNGYKFEYLVLDMIKLMGNCLAVEIERDREFAPVKNKTGTDSVESARALLVKNGVKL